MCNADYTHAMAHEHTDADDTVATALSANLHEQQTQGRSLENIDYTFLAESAMDAFMDYEDEMNREYLDAHPDCITSDNDEQVLRRKIANDIRDLPCVYTGTEAIAFKSARELAARIAEFDEQD
jgi:hypothetical protein